MIEEFFPHVCFQDICRGNFLKRYWKECFSKIVVLYKLATIYQKSEVRLKMKKIFSLSRLVLFIFY